MPGVSRASSLLLALASQLMDRTGGADGANGEE